MHASLDEYLVWMQAQNFSDDTVTTRRDPASATSSTGVGSAAWRIPPKSRGPFWSVTSGLSTSTAKRTGSR